MIKIKNKIIPFKGYIAITIWPFIFYRANMNNIDLNHENIHGEQQKELLIIPFYLIYLVEWIFKGYENISFEKEAYKNQNNLSYLNSRKRWSMW